MAVSMTFNSVAQPSYLSVTDIVGRDPLSPISINKQRLPLLSKSEIQNRYLNDRTIRVEAYITSTSIDNLRDNVRDLAEWLNTTDRQSLVFSDETDVLWYAIVDNTDLDRQFWSNGRVRITFDCLPLSYSTAETVDSLNTPESNDGSFEVSDFVINATMTSGASCAEFELTASGKTGFIKLNTALLVDDDIQIDSESRRVYVNSVDKTSLCELTTIDWFNIPVGSYSIDVANATGTITYRRRYL